jgi:hypothetical protein
MSVRQLIRLALLLSPAACVSPPAMVTGKPPERTRERQTGAPAVQAPTRKELYDKRTDAEKSAAEMPGFERADPSLARVGAARTHEFHKPDCPVLKDVPDAERLRFTTPWESVDAGFRPCDECRPIR